MPKYRVRRAVYKRAQKESDIINKAIITSSMSINTQNYNNNYMTCSHNSVTESNIIASSRCVHEEESDTNFDRNDDSIYSENEDEQNTCNFSNSINHAANNIKAPEIFTVTSAEDKFSPQNRNLCYSLAE